MRKFSMFVLMGLAAMILAPAAFAQETAGAAASTNWVAITSGFAIAIAAGLCGLGQAKVAAAAAEGLARNPGARPGIQLALFLGLAFIESLVLFTFVTILLKVQ